MPETSFFFKHGSVVGVQRGRFFTICWIVSTELLEPSLRAGAALKPQHMTHVNRNHTCHPPFQPLRVCPSFTSTAIIHQIYLHRSRAKIKPDPRDWPLHPVSPGQIQSQLDTFYDWLASNPIEFLLLVVGRGEGGQKGSGGRQPARLKVIMHWQESDMARGGRGGGDKRDSRRVDII